MTNEEASSRPDPLAGIGELATLFGVTTRSMRRACEEGRVPSATRTLGGHWRVPSSCVALVRRSRHRGEA